MFEYLLEVFRVTGLAFVCQCLLVSFLFPLRRLYVLCTRITLRGDGSQKDDSSQLEV